MFAPISAIFGLLFFASTLPNGIRLVELPAQENVVEIVAGYTSGELKDFVSTAAANTLLFDAYAAGGNIAIIQERDRTALRITAPKWSLPLLSDRLPALFKELPVGDKGADPSSPDFVGRIEEEIRSALLGAARPAVDYATGDAFILISEPPPPSLREALGAIPKRGVVTPPDETLSRFPGERTLRFKSDLPVGGVIFASPIPSVYYRQWYSVLMLDRLIRRILPLAQKTTLALSSRPHYYRIEVEVPSGQYPEAIEERLLQELERLQLTPVSAQDLDGARQEALTYLDSKTIREWFASHDILSRREEGMQWVQSMSADDMRIAVRDLLITNRVIASYAPRPRQTVVTSEPLSAVPVPVPKPSPSGRGTPSAARQGEGSHTPFPNHAHSPATTSLAERLASGVSVATSTTNAVFISNGPMIRYDRELSEADLKSFQQYGANRIFVLTPPASLDRARQLWNAFKGAGTESPVSRGKVTGGDLPALFILKTMIDLKLIQAGWSSEASVRLDAGEGSDLQVHGTEEQRAQILEWIKSIAAAPPADAEFAWVREVAIHRLALAIPDLQALMWERDPKGALPDLETVSPKHVQDVARIYF